MKVRSKTINPKRVEWLVDHWVYNHRLEVRAILKENPKMSRATAELKAARRMDPLLHDDGVDGKLLRAILGDDLDVMEAVKILSQYFVSPSDIGGPTHGMTCGGGRRVIRKGHEFS